MEIWKEVFGYNGIYFVSNTGLVKSIDHHPHGRKGNGKQTGRILKQHKCCKGYLRVSLSMNKTRFSTGAHRLVAIAFIPNVENLPQVNHIDGIKSNNNASNLEWCNNSENQIHAVKNGLVKHNKCEKHHMSKLSDKQVCEARKMHHEGVRNIELSRIFNISAAAMSSILRKKTYINLK